MKNINALLLTAYEVIGAVGMEELIECFIDENFDGNEIDLSAYSEYLSEFYPDDCFYSMEEFDELMNNVEPWEIARSCFFGDFKPCNDYFGFNGYGNLTSFAEWEIINKAKDDRDFLKWYIEQNDLIDEEEAQAIIDECNELIRKGF